MKLGKNKQTNKHFSQEGEEKEGGREHEGKKGSTRRQIGKKWQPCFSKSRCVDASLARDLLSPAS